MRMAVTGTIKTFVVALVHLAISTSGFAQPADVQVFGKLKIGMSKEEVARTVARPIDTIAKWSDSRSFPGFKEIFSFDKEARLVGASYVKELERDPEKHNTTFFAQIAINSFDSLVAGISAERGAPTYRRDPMHSTVVKGFAVENRGRVELFLSASAIWRFRETQIAVKIDTTPSGERKQLRSGLVFSKSVNSSLVITAWHHL